MMSAPNTTLKKTSDLHKLTYRLSKHTSFSHPGPMACSVTGLTASLQPDRQVDLSHLLTGLQHRCVQSDTPKGPQHEPSNQFQM